MSRTNQVDTAALKKELCAKATKDIHDALNHYIAAQAKQMKDQLLQAGFSPEEIDPALEDIKLTSRVILINKFKKCLKEESKKSAEAKKATKDIHDALNHYFIAQSKPMKDQLLQAGFSPDEIDPALKDVKLKSEVILIDKFKKRLEEKLKKNAEAKMESKPTQMPLTPKQKPTKTVVSQTKKYPKTRLVKPSIKIK